MDLDVKHHYAQINGLRYHYVEAGEGPPLLLLHGFPESWWSWRHQIEPLVKAGHRVVAPDQRGYGETDWRGPYDLDTLARDISALITAIGAEEADVCGHGWGGAVAWHLAAMHPARVRKLAVLGCPHPAQMATALRQSPSQLGRSWYLFLFQLPWLPERVLPHIGQAVYGTRSRLSQEEIRPFLENLAKPGAAKAMLGWYRAAFRDAMRTAWRVPTYPTIEAETLLVWARDDFDLSCDELVPGTERHAPKLTVETLDECGHFMHEEQAERVNPALLRFFALPDEPHEAESAYNVVLRAVGENKIGVIREVRAITGLDLPRVKDLVEAVPKTIVEGASLEEAEHIRKQLAEVGASVELADAMQP